MKFIKAFKGVPSGEIYPVEYQPGDECPEELEDGAAALGAIEAGQRSRKTPASTRSRADLDEALSSLPGEYTDADYVVNAMRSHFAGLFTDADEAQVRSLVKPATAKPSDGLKVDEIKAALAAKNIEIPEGVTLKADLAALLDSAP